MLADDEPYADGKVGKGHYRQQTKPDKENRNADACDRHPCCEVQTKFGPRTTQRLIDCLRFSQASYSLLIADGSVGEEREGASDGPFFLWHVFI